MSAILQCLVHCPPVQKYFLHDVGHNHISCAQYRHMALPMDKANKQASGPNLCLGCEVDKVFLMSFGSAVGRNAIALISMNPFGRGTSPMLTSRHSKPRHPDNSELTTRLLKGDPLTLTDMLTAVWKCKGMAHLSGYEQRDAHEFLHAFFDVLGKHMTQYRARVHQTINIPRPNNVHEADFDGKSNGKWQRTR